MWVLKNFLIIILIISITIIGWLAYSFFEKGKYLSRVEFQLLETPDACLGINFTNKKDSKYNKIVINTEEEYQNFINELKGGSHGVCQNVEFPKIDFQKETLVGAIASFWCRAYLERDMRIDDNKKLYRYIIQEKLNCIPIIGCGARSCVSMRSLNLAIIPKMKDGYHMQFDVYENPWR